MMASSAVINSISLGQASLKIHPPPLKRRATASWHSPRNCCSPGLQTRGLSSILSVVEWGKSSEQSAGGIPQFLVCERHVGCGTREKSRSAAVSRKLARPAANIRRAFQFLIQRGRNFLPTRESIRKQSHARHVIEFLHPSKPIGRFRSGNNSRPIDVDRSAAYMNFRSRIHLHETPAFAMSDAAGCHRFQNDGAAGARHFYSQRLAKSRARVWDDVIEKIFERGSFADVNYSFEDSGFFRGSINSRR